MHTHPTTASKKIYQQRATVRPMYTVPHEILLGSSYRIQQRWAPVALNSKSPANQKRFCLKRATAIRTRIYRSTALLAFACASLKNVPPIYAP